MITPIPATAKPTIRIEHITQGFICTKVVLEHPIDDQIFTLFKGIAEVDDRARVCFEAPYLCQCVQINDNDLHWDGFIESYLIGNGFGADDNGHHVAEHDRTQEEDRVLIRKRKVMTEREALQRNLRFLK